MMIDADIVDQSRCLLNGSLLTANDASILMLQNLYSMCVRSYMFQGRRNRIHPIDDSD